MESLGRHDDVEATVANVLQVGEPSTLVVGDEPPVLADVVLAENKFPNGVSSGCEWAIQAWFSSRTWFGNLF